MERNDRRSSCKSLKIAVTNRTDNTKELIYHSDRGSQYCSFKYTSFLKKQNILISMTENGDPYENPKAERMNGILKDEFEIRRFSRFITANDQISQAVNCYNQYRPHLSCNYLTPDQAYHYSGTLKKQWKITIKKKIITRYNSICHASSNYTFK